MINLCYILLLHLTIFFVWNQFFQLINVIFFFLTPVVSPLSLGKSSNKELKTIPVISIPSAAKRPRSEDAEDFRKQQEVTPRALSAQTKPLAEGEVVALVQDHTTEPEAPLDASWKDVKCKQLYSNVV